MKVAEIFPSIHGEVNGHHQGRMCTFVRFSGCNCKCWYCDTAHTQNPNYGTEMSVMQIIHRVQEIGNKYICLTGGEPLLQKIEVEKLLYWLWQNKFSVSVETNGTIDITPFYRYVDSFVIDYKVGVSNYRCYINNFLNLREKDVVKFVVNELTLMDAIKQYHLVESFYLKNHIKPIFAFSPIISENFSAKDLYNSLKSQGFHNVLISLQIHKIADFS